MSADRGYLDVVVIVITVMTWAFGGVGVFIYPLFFSFSAFGSGTTSGQSVVFYQVGSSIIISNSYASLHLSSKLFVVCDMTHSSSLCYPSNYAYHEAPH